MITDTTARWTLQIIIGFLFVLYLLGMIRLRNPALKERGHFVVSFIPWIQVLISYGVALYVRIGFGTWPRSCLDNPDLPLLGFLVPVAIIGCLLCLWVLPVLWISWFVIRLLQGFRRLWLSSMLIFASGTLALFTLMSMDPFGFWEWVFD